MEEGERPAGRLTRRELRARREAEERAAAEREAAEPGAGESGAAELGAGEPAAGERDAAAAPTSGQALPGDVGDAGDEIVEDTVELPRRLPPEPDVDDVRWGAPVPGVGVRVPIAERTGELPAVPRPDAEPGGAGTGAPAPAPAEEEDLAVVLGLRADPPPPAADPGTGGVSDRVPDGPPAPPERRSRRGRRAADTQVDAVPGRPEGAVGPPTPAGPPAPAPVTSAPTPPAVPSPARPAAATPPAATPPAPPSPPSGTPTPPGLTAPPTATPPPPVATPSSGGRPLRPVPVPNASWTDPAAPLPTLDDLLAQRPAPRSGPAEQGWRGAVRRLSGGLIAPEPGPREQEHRRAVAAVQRSLDGPRTIVVLNPKGGAHKTTATLLIAATFGEHRGGYTLAWDNNETRGTLGWRSAPARHQSTAVNLLQDLDRFVDASGARVGDLDGYVRHQRAAGFDVLASDEDAASAASIDAFAFRSLHRTLARFYRVMVVDTGNNMRASNWQAAVEAADQVVIVSTVREDTAQSAAWAVDALRATGHADVVANAVTVLSAPAPKRDEALAARLHEHFGRLTRTVLDVPYDPSLVAGTPIDYRALSAATKEAWLRVTAAVADGL